MWDRSRFSAVTALTEAGPSCIHITTYYVRGTEQRQYEHSTERAAGAQLGVAPPHEQYNHISFSQQAVVQCGGWCRRAMRVRNPAILVFLLQYRPYCTLLIRASRVRGRVHA